MSEEFTLKELANLFDPDKFEKIEYRPTVRSRNPEDMRFYPANMFPLFLETESTRSGTPFEKGKPGKDYYPSEANLDLKAFRKDDLVEIYLVGFTFNVKRKRGYALMLVRDKVHGKEDFIELYREGVGLYVLTPSSSEYRYDIFNNAKSILYSLFPEARR